MNTATWIGAINMPHIYSLRTDTIFDEENNLHTVYGINAIDSESGKSVSIPNLFCNKDVAARFVERCNRSGLSIVHLYEAIEDALEEF